MAPQNTASPKQAVERIDVVVVVILSSFLLESVRFRMARAFHFSGSCVMRVLRTMMTTLALAAPAIGDVYSYECDTLPSDAGWTLYQAFCDPAEWVAEGRLFQRVELCYDYDPPASQVFDYNRSESEFVGHPTFFMDWTVRTDGSADEIPYIAPVSFSAWNGGSVRYHAIIAQDVVKLVRDLELPILFFQIDPLVDHNYRIELYGATLYRWYIDEQVVDEGVPEGNYLTLHPTVYIRAKAVFGPSTAVWSHIRWGDIPIDASGDYDSNGTIDLLDLRYFEECRERSGAGVDAGPGCRWADMNADGDVDAHDLGAFQVAFVDSR